MPIINNSYFNSERIVPNLSYPEVSALLTDIIKVRETEYLTKALGYELFSLFVAGIAVPTPDTRYLNILNGVTFTNKFGQLQRFKGLKDEVNYNSPIADYVYYYWLKYKHTQVSESGVVQSDNQNSKIVSGKHKACDAWNKMVDNTSVLCDYLALNSTLYPEFKWFRYDLDKLTTKIQPFF